MAKETLNARVTRLETAMADLTDKVNILMDAQIRTEKRFDEVGKRFEQMGERIEGMVGAIGELIRRMDADTLRPRS